MSDWIAVIEGLNEPPRRRQAPAPRRPRVLQVRSNGLGSWYDPFVSLYDAGKDALVSTAKDEAVDRVTDLVDSFPGAGRTGAGTSSGSNAIDIPMPTGSSYASSSKSPVADGGLLAWLATPRNIGGIGLVIGALWLALSD